MTKISFDVDFSKDPEKILQEIQERAKAEVEKRESKERNAAYLSKLHEKVNEKIGTEYKSVSDLIRALTPYAAPSLRDKLSGTTASGRRKTISMNKEVYDEVKKLLSEPNPNKAAIARQSGVSVVQVRKVADGGFDEKFGGNSATPNKMSSIQSKSSPKSLPPIKDSEEEAQESLPSLPTFEDKEDLPAISEEIKDEPAQNDLPEIPTFEDKIEEAPMLPPVDIDPPSAPVVDEQPVTEGDGEKMEEPDGLLPPLPTFTPAPFNSDEDPSVADDTSDAPAPPLPSFGDEENESISPPPIGLSPPLPPTSPVVSSMSEEESDSTEEVSPPLSNVTPAPLDGIEDDSDNAISEDAPPLPSFGDDENDSPLPPPIPAPTSDLPPPVPAPEEEPTKPEEKSTPDFEATPPTPEEAPPAAPPTPPAPSAPTGGLTRPPTGLKPTLKPKLGADKKGKPSLSLKPKSKTTGLKITRPPMRGTPPPS
jgi:hypothetical protein